MSIPCRFAIQGRSMVGLLLLVWLCWVVSSSFTSSTSSFKQPSPPSCLHFHAGFKLLLLLFMLFTQYEEMYFLSEQLIKSQ